MVTRKWNAVHPTTGITIRFHRFVSLVLGFRNTKLTPSNTNTDILNKIISIGKLYAGDCTVECNCNFKNIEFTSFIQFRTF